MGVEAIMKGDLLCSCVMITPLLSFFSPGDGMAQQTGPESSLEGVFQVEEP